MWAHEEAGQPERKALERGEIRHTLSGAIADQELMLEQERLSCDPAHAARAEGFREGNEQMDRQEEQIAHELKLSRRPICTRLRRFTPKFTNSRPTGQGCTRIRMPRGLTPLSACLWSCC